jgi:hypothetical protein
MINTLDETQITDRLDLVDGDAIVLLDRLGKGDVYEKEEQARNIFRVDATGHVRWQVRTDFDAEGNPFTGLNRQNDAITAYRWDGGRYSLDISNGVATPMMLER